MYLMKLKFITILFFLFTTSCIKSNSDFSDSDSSTSTTDNKDKIYLDSLDFNSFKDYVGASYSETKAALDKKYIDTAFVSNQSEVFAVFIKDNRYVDPYFVLLFYQNGQSIYAIDVQNVNTISSDNLWNMSLDWADSTSNLTSAKVNSTIYNGSIKVYETTSLNQLKQAYLNNIDYYSPLQLQMIWDNTLLSYAILTNPSSGVLTWLVQKGNISSSL